MISTISLGRFVSKLHRLDLEEGRALTLQAIPSENNLCNINVVQCIIFK